LVAGSEEYHLTGQANSNAKHGNTIIYGGPGEAVPELLFEKKQLTPALQQLLVSRND
jgi:hypothetical protein